MRELPKSERGDALLECVIFLPFLLGIGFFTLDFSERAFQTSQLSQLAHAAIEGATLLRRESELSSVAKETFALVDEALPNSTDLTVSLTLLNSEGSILGEAETHRGTLRKSSLERELRKLVVPAKISSLPYATEESTVRLASQYLAIQIFISAKRILPGEPAALQETQIRPLREVK